MGTPSDDDVEYQLWRCKKPCGTPSEVLFRDHPEDVRCSSCNGRLAFQYTVNVARGGSAT